MYQAPGCLVVRYKEVSIKDGPLDSLGQVRNLYFFVEVREVVDVRDVEPFRSLRHVVSRHL